MNCRDVFVNINVGSLFVYVCMFIFFLLLSLRLDQVFVCSYVIIFIPIWIWNITTVSGFVIGCVFWCKKRETYRFDDEHKAHCGALVYTFVFLSVVFLGEMLMVVSADNPSLPWRAAFTPFYLLTILSAVMIWWMIYKKRSCELELLSLLTSLQLILLGVRLDSVSSWTWAVTLVPTWLALIAVTVALILYSIILPLVNWETWSTAESSINKIRFPLFVISALLIIIFFILFLVLLVVRLDRNVAIPFSVIFIPLHLTVLTLMSNEITRNWSGNLWWFGIQQKYGELLLQKSSLIQEFVNISYMKDDLLPPRQPEDGGHSTLSGKERLVLGTIEDLESPD